MYEHAAISLDMLTHKTTTFTITEINIVYVYFDSHCEMSCLIVIRSLHQTLK